MVNPTFDTGTRLQIVACSEGNSGYLDGEWKVCRSAARMALLLAKDDG